MSDDVERQGGLQRWRDFVEDTTMHGLKYTSHKKVHILRRLVWVLMIIGTLVYFGFAARIFMSDYFKRIVNTKVRVAKASELTFPTVTICNKNFWKKSVMDSYEAMLGEYWLNQIMNDLFLMGIPPPPPDKYDWSSPELLPISYLRSNDTEEFLEQSAHSLEMTFQACFWQEQTIDCPSVLKLVKTDAGYCHQFNSDGEFTVESAGTSGGLSLLLDTHVAEYSVGPGSYAEGFFIIFHEKNEVPLVRELGVGVAPGTQSSIMLHKSETDREPPPADDGKADCFDSAKLTNPLHYYQTYSSSACFTECKTSYVMEMCGCRDLLQPENFTTDPKGLKSCRCPDPCFQTEYTPKVSMFTFPSPMYAEMAGMNETMTEYARKNYVYVDIFFGKMSYQKLEEFIAYSEVDMLASLGGTLGVCLGASFLTIAEFVEFGCLSIFRCFRTTKKQQKQVMSTPVKPFITETFLIDEKNATQFSSPYQPHGLPSVN